MNTLDVLIQKGFLKKEDRVIIEKEMRMHGVPLEEALDKYGVPLETTLSTVANFYNLPYRILKDSDIPSTVLKYIPEVSARHYRFVPLGVVNGALEIGITNPDDIESLDALQFISGKIGMPYQLYLISTIDFKKVIDAYKNITGEIGEALSEFENDAVATPSREPKEISHNVSSSKKGKSKEDIKADAPITKVVATILRYAVEGGASDVHIEPLPDKTRVRFRMDGVLHTSLQLPSKVHTAVVARIKILAQMRLDEKRKPQDGRFSANVSDRSIDFRVSTFPTQFGEKVVMRILDQTKSKRTLETLGLEGENLEAVRAAVRQPYGIVLVSGPTGSGKSTTLFATLSEIDRETKNVVSLEDPVEYNISGVSQSQVHPEIGYTFANGLRSILRQDPDIIMVGEIRDKETAQLAIQAALTGHLVFSTLHTNTASDAIPRLIDMGVDPYLIAPTLLVIVGQRLVRTLCPNAGKPFPISDSLQVLLNKEFSDLPQEFHKNLPKFEHFYHASSTTECPNGTSGRIGVFEVLRMDKELEHIVLTNPISEDIYTAARKKGMVTMREDAIIKALDGRIPFEEVNTLGGSVFPEKEDDIN